MPDVLIVEDEPSILSSLEFILRHAGWEVASVTDGEAALSSIRTNPPRAVVLDVMMPKKSGFEVLKEMRDDPGTAALPVLMLTAKGQQQDIETARQLGATAFVSKPYANADVVGAVADMLGAKMAEDG